MSTTHRLTVELTATDFLQRIPEGGFRIGPAVRDLSDSTPRPPTLAERAPHVVEDLADALHLPTRVGVLEGLEVAYIEKAPDYTPVTSFSPAARRPAHATALGKVLLAFAAPDVLRLAATASLPAYTPNTICRPDRLHHALHRIRCDGLAVDRGELMPDIYTVAVPRVGPGQRRDRGGGGGGGGPGGGDGRGGDTGADPRRPRAQPGAAPGLVAR